MRKKHMRRWAVIGLLLASLNMMSCSVAGLGYLAGVLMGLDTRVEARFTFPKQARDDHPYRILVITNADLGTQLDMGHVDRQLNDLVARKIFEGLEADGKKYKVIDAKKVEKWQDEHHNWRTLAPNEIGQALEAGYVVYLEVENISFFEDGTRRQLLQGRADVGVTVWEVNDNGGNVVFGPDVHSCEFPKGRPVSASDLALVKFRRAFLSRLAEEISWFFIPHDSGLDYGREPF